MNYLILGGALVGAWYGFLIDILLPPNPGLFDLLFYTAFAGFIGGVRLGQLVDGFMGWNLMGL